MLKNETATIQEVQILDQTCSTHRLKLSSFLQSSYKMQQLPSSEQLLLKIANVKLQSMDMPFVYGKTCGCHVTMHNLISQFVSLITQA